MTSNTNKLKHWSLKFDAENITWLTFDQHKSNVNTLSRSTISELATALTIIEAASPRALVIQSAKRASFVVGADIEEFTHIQSAQEARDLVAGGQAVCATIESLPIPTIALIHGFCLGGGLELALACDYRITEDAPSCRLGVPEIRLGIHPAFGGTVRLIETVGPILGMDLMLSGRSLIARKAAKLGLVDRAIPKRHFDLAVEDFVKRAPPKASLSKGQRILNSAIARPLLAAYLKRLVAHKAREGHYPAPYSLINLWKEHGADREAMFKAEADSVSALASHPTSRNLVRVFFLQETLKQAGKAQNAIPIKHLHVIGAGVMGGDIAAWAALQGLRVTLQDRNPESITRALQRAKKLFKKKLKADRAVQGAMDRLTPDLRGEGVKKADLILEAIFEDLEVKQTVFKALEKMARPDAILATNTSSIPIEDIANVLKKPGRLVGIHFFNPVAKMQLIEVVSGVKTLKKITTGAAQFARQIKRLPVPIKSSPGFLVNRVLVPYLIEAVHLNKEGHTLEAIDKAALEYGMPMGPVELADVVGLDICKHVADNILGTKNVPSQLKELIDNGHLGKKTGMGFYRYKKGKPVKQKAQLSVEQTLAIQDRLILPLLNECVACLDEGIVESQQHLDGGVIFGTGYAPFTGGPIKTIQDRDATDILTKLQKLAEQKGARYTPSEGWKTFI
jgi:3-hydroxyacyl-CoA dehydrogenase/enoyl-CoA hydratase/3-hydroxybutyryl-CoA epimerase